MSSSQLIVRPTFLNTNAAEAPVLHKGESLFTRAGDCFLLDNNFNVLAAKGVIFATNFRLIFRSNEVGEMSVPMSCIYKYEKVGKSTQYDAVSLSCRDCRVEYIGFLAGTNGRKELVKALDKFLTPSKVTDLFCMSFVADCKFQVDGWQIFQIENEFKRQGIDMKDWRITVANDKYRVCDSYPKKIMIPSCLPEEAVFGLAQVRFEGKLTIFCWGSSKIQGVLLRSSSLSLVEDDSIGVGDIQRSGEDEQYLQFLKDYGSTGNLTIADTTTKDEVRPDLLPGVYVSCRWEFLNLAKADMLMDSYRRLVSLVTSSTVMVGGEYDKMIENTKWLNHIHQLITSADGIITKICSGEPVIVQNLDNSGNVVVLTSFIQVLLDPYYRTFQGFAVLVEKEWITYGHRFGNFHKKIKGKPTDLDIYSIYFIQFLDCVWQAICQFPTAFEYDTLMLLYVIESLFSCQFGTFVFANEKERESCSKKTVSVWSMLLNDCDQIRNKSFQPIDGPLRIDCDRRKVLLWNQYYLRFRFRTQLSRSQRTLQTAVKKHAIWNLDLSSLTLPEIPPIYLEMLTWVRDLNISGNLLNSVPFEIVYMSQLEKLNISKNQISYVSDQFLWTIQKRVTSLTDLNFGNNHFSGDLSVILSSFSQLKAINFRGNQLKSMPNLDQMIHLESIDFSNNQIDRMACDLSKFNQLRSLRLSRNNFNFPEGLTKLSDIQYLSLARLQDLKTVPEVILGLFNLRHLNLAESKIESIPTEISRLTLLENLKLNANLLTKFPTELTFMTSLIVLKMSHNQIRGIPFDVANLTRLTSLDLSHNKLSAITPGVGRLTNLTSLDISHNTIEHIPATIGFLERLRIGKKFKFEENKLRTPPKEVVAEGYDRIFGYLQELLEGFRPTYRMKIMLVGQENVGKTSLLRCLTTKNYLDRDLKKATNLDSMSTDGIDIGRLVITGEFPDENDPSKGVKKTKIELSAWDFAGQEIYYTTHQFFLSDRSVYLLVWNMAKAEENSRVEYWLRSIQARAPKAPIIICGTHLDDAKCTKPYVNDVMLALENKYATEFKNIRAIVPISCANQTGLKELKLWVQAVVLDQPHMGELIPTTYLQLENMIASERVSRVPPVVTMAEFMNMGTICNIRTEEGLLTASALLHSLGSLIHFQKEKTLSDLVILDPQWLTNVMSSIITTKHAFIKNGILEHRDLVQIWRSEHFPVHLHPLLLTLLEKFEITFFLRSTKASNDIYTGRSLVASLLPEDRPANLEQIFPRFPPKGESQFGRRYEFKFIPHGFVSRLLVRILHYAEPAVIWRYGIVIVVEKQKIQIECQVARKYVELTIRGFETGSLFQYILETIDNLIKGWQKNEPLIKVPCIHCVQERMYDPFMFTFDDCEHAAIEGKSVVKCNGVRGVRLDILVPDIAMTHVSNCRINYADITVEKQIGEGGFATVYRGIYRDQVVAVKKIRFSSDSEANLMAVSELQAFQEFRREVWIMSGLIHQNLVQMAGFSIDPFCIVTEFVGCGNLFEVIHERTSWTMCWGFRWRCALDMAKGMAFLHNMTPPIIHRDLKSPNVLMASLNERDEVLAKVADFGLSQTLAANAAGRSVDNPVWLAPEILRNEDYDEKADVYSFGVMMYELYSRNRYFGDVRFMSDLEDRVLTGERPSIGDDCPVEFKELMVASWDNNPANRPSFNVICEKLAAAIKKYHPDLYDIAIAQKDLQVMRASEQIAHKQEEEEDNRHRADSDELRRCMIVVEAELSASVTALAYACVVDTMWSATSDGSITVFDCKTNRKVIDFQAHEKRIFALLLWNDFMWSASQDNTIRVWNIRDYKMKKEIKCEGVISFGRTPKNIWAGTSQSYVQICDPKAMKIKKKLKILDGRPITSVVHVQTNNSVWVAADNLIAMVPEKAKKVDSFLEGHSKQVTSLVFVRGFVWSASTDRTLRIWNPETGDCIKILSGHGGPVYALAVGREHVWSGSWDKTLMAWNIEFKYFHKEYAFHNDLVGALALAETTGKVWAGSNDKRLTQWTVV